MCRKRTQTKTIIFKLRKKEKETEVEENIADVVAKKKDNVQKDNSQESAQIEDKSGEPKSAQTEDKSDEPKTSQMEDKSEKPKVLKPKIQIKVLTSQTQERVQSSDNNHSNVRKKPKVPNKTNVAAHQTASKLLNSARSKVKGSWAYVNKERADGAKATKCFLCGEQKHTLIHL